MIYLLIFYTGSCIASFLYCFCYRYINNENFILERSKCDCCKHQLSFLDLIPIFSYAFNKGRCRYCKNKISIVYLLSEITLGIIFLLLYIRLGISVRHIVLIMLLFCISVIDYKELIIPDRFVLIGIFNRILFTKSFNELLNSLLNSLITVLPIILLVIIMNKVLHKESMGMGDIKLFFMLGLYFSYFYNLVAIIISCLIGIIYIFISKKDIIPYGPAICLAYLTILLIF